MADWRSAKFKWRMKAYRDNLKKKEQDSIENEKEQPNSEDVKRILEIWQNSKKKNEKENNSNSRV